MNFDGLEEKFSEKSITSFSFHTEDNPSLTSTVHGTISGKTIQITVPSGTDLNVLTPSIKIKGSSLNPGNKQAVSFTSSRVYTVQAEDGSTSDYRVIVNLAAAGTGNTDLDSNLMARYFFSGDYTDSSAAGNNLLVSGSVTWEDNRVSAPSSAVLITSPNGYLYKTDDASLNPGTSLTISAWIYFDDITIDQKIIGKVNAAQNAGYVMGVRGGNIFVQIWDSAGVYYSIEEPGTGPLLSDDRWVHLAMTWETGGKLRAYIDGAMAGEINAGSNPIGTNSDNLIIGACPWNTSLIVDDGIIDDIRMYNTALTAGDINDLFSLPAD